jgi:hypothetical protein
MYNHYIEQVNINGEMKMQTVNVKTLIAKVPAAKDFGLTSAVLMNGELMTVSDYDLPADLVAELQAVANA